MAMTAEDFTFWNNRAKEVTDEIEAAKRGM